MAARLFLLLICLLALFCWYSDWPQPQMSNHLLQPPSPDHWLGTDVLGQDLLERLLQALPGTLATALVCGLLPLLAGLALASLSALAGKLTDQLLLKLTDIFMIMPAILPLMILSALLEPSLGTVIILISALAWPDDFRVLRAAIRRQLLGDAVLTARSLGAGPVYLLRWYVWPVLRPLLLALFLQNARRAVMLSAGLAFLGLTDPRMANWGTLLLEAQQQIHHRAFWWLLPGPLLAITALILLLNRLEPKERGQQP